MESSLELVGQEMVPYGSPGEFLGAAGVVEQTASEGREIVVAAPQDSLTGPRASDAARSQDGEGAGQIVVANPVLSIGIGTPQSVQSAPNGHPVSYGPAGSQNASREPVEHRVPNGQHGENLLPLCDDQQLRRFC